MSYWGVTDVIQQRIVMSRTIARALSIKSDIKKQEGEEYGVTTTIDKISGLRGLDFIETEKSWLRQFTMMPYKKAVAEGYRVTIIVPDVS
jgi:hypothetical protein